MISVEAAFEDDVASQPQLDLGKIERFAGRVLAGYGLNDGDCTIVFIGDRYMSELNETYKGRPGTTDVLSFDLTDTRTKRFSGEIYISLERVREQAEELGIPFETEIVRMISHGLLHLSGHHHDTDETYTTMTVEMERLVNDFFSKRDEP
jgi:probable rRNA maturation factor